MKLRSNPANVETWYRHFPRRGPCLVGEFTPSYILPPGPALLYRSAPNARIILMLRDPIDRLESAITMDARRRNGLTLEIMAAQERRNRYNEQLENLYHSYPPEQVLVLQYEQCVADTSGELARTHLFLGLDQQPNPPEWARPVNKTIGAKLVLTESERTGVVHRLWADISRLTELVPDLDIARWSTTLRYAPDDSLFPSPVRVRAQMNRAE